jgi:hypothetical protein
MKDMHNSMKVVASVVPAVLTATATGTGVDLRGFSSAEVIINTGAIVSSGNFTPKLQESDDNSTWTDVEADDLLGTFPAALAASTAYNVGYAGTKGHLRAVLTLNSGTSIAAGAVIVCGNAHLSPVA